MFGFVPLRMPVRNSNEDIKEAFCYINTLWSSRENIGQRYIIHKGGSSYSHETGEGLLFIYCLSTPNPPLFFLLSDYWGLPRWLSG